MSVWSGIGCILLLSSGNLSANGIVPADVEAIFQTAKRHFDIGEFDEALSTFQTLLAREPHYAPALYYVTLIDKMRERKIEMMTEALTRMERSGPGSQAEAMEEALERLERRPHASEPKTGMRLLIDGHEVGLEHPLLMHEGRLLIPLPDIASTRNVSLFEVGDGAVQLIFPDGTRKRLVVSSPRLPVPMLTEQELRELFEVQTFFDEPRHTLDVRTPLSTHFEAYDIERPSDMVEEPPAEQQPLQTEAARDKTGTIPPAARPSIDLRSNVYYSLSNPHAAPTGQSLFTTLGGRVYDFDVFGETTLRDLTGHVHSSYATTLNLHKPDLAIGLFQQSTSLAPLRGQSAGFQGLKVQRTWERGNTTTVLGGDMQATGAESVKYMGRLYEVQQEIAPQNWLRLRSAMLYLENHADLESLSGTTTFPRNDFVSFSDLSLRLTRNMVANAQVARSQYQADNTPDAWKSDWDWRVGSTFQGRRSSLDVAYERVGDRYASLGNPAGYQDYAGLDLFGTYEVTDTWSIGGSMLRYHNNVTDDPTHDTNENQIVSFSSQVQLRGNQSVGVAVSHALTNPRGPSVGTSSRTLSYYLQYQRPFFFDSGLLMSTRVSQADQPAGSDSKSYEMHASLFKQFGQGSIVSLNQQLVKSTFKEAADQLVSSTSLSASYQLWRSLDLYGRASYNRNMTDELAGVDIASGATGLRWKLDDDTTLSSEYNINSYNFDTEKGRWPRNWSWLFSVSQYVGFVTAPNFGSVEGWIVQDANANGRFDPGERGVEDVLVHVEDGHEMVTNATGFFRFSRLAPGRQRIAINQENLPPELVLVEPSQEVNVRRRKLATVYYFAVRSASISGQVFIDENLDHIPQSTEEPLEGVAVVLSPGEQFRRTGEDGTFTFDHLTPGSYVLQVHEEDLPKGYVLSSHDPVTVSVGSGDEVKGVSFAVRLDSDLLKRF